MFLMGGNCYRTSRPLVYIGAVVPCFSIYSRRCVGTTEKRARWRLEAIAADRLDRRSKEFFDGCCGKKSASVGENETFTITAVHCKYTIQI